MELFIIRHGQSANNALPNIRDREVDPPLTELGERQAEIVAGYLVNGETHDIPASSTNNSRFQMRKGFGINALFSSAMYRSLQTVQPIAKSLGLAPQIWVDLHEEGGMYRDHGGAEGVVGYPGRTRSEILAEFAVRGSQGRQGLETTLANGGGGTEGGHGLPRVFHGRLAKSTLGSRFRAGHILPSPQHRDF